MGYPFLPPAAGVLKPALDCLSKLSFDERLKKATAGLFGRLNAPPRRFNCWVPVEGLKLDGPHARFGGVRFLTFRRLQVRAMARARPKPTSQAWRHLVRFSDKDLVTGRTYAEPGPGEAFSSKRQHSAASRRGCHGSVVDVPRCGSFHLCGECQRTAGVRSGFRSVSFCRIVPR